MGPEMAEDVEMVKLSVKKDQDDLGLIVQAKSQNAVRFVMLAALAAVVIAITAAFFITKTIASPMQKVVHFVDDLARGDFTTELQINQEDEIGSMYKALGRTVTELGKFFHTKTNKLALDQDSQEFSLKHTDKILID